MPPEAAGQLADFFDYLQVECGLSGNTCQAYSRDLSYFLEHLGGRKAKSLSKLAPSDVEGFCRYARQRGLSATSVARALAAIRTFCRYLVVQQVCQHDPAASVDSPKKWHRLPTVMDHQTVWSLLEAPDDDQDAHGPRDRAILTLLYAAGLAALLGIRLWWTLSTRLRRQATPS